MKQVRELFLTLRKKRDLSKAVHETAIILLAAASVVLAIYDIHNESKPWMNAADLAIWGIFLADYTVRIQRSKNKWKFFLHNIPDLLTILPFLIALYILRSIHISEFSLAIKALKCLRCFSLLLRILKYCLKIMRTHGIRFVILVTAMVVASGGIAIYYIEGLPILDSLWWAFVTAATVGYGDLSPSTNAGRLVAVLLMITGIGLIGSLTSTITSAVLSAHKKTTVKSEVKELLKEQIDRVESLNDDEVEQLCGMIRALHAVPEGKQDQAADDGE